MSMTFAVTALALLIFNRPVSGSLVTYNPSSQSNCTTTGQVQGHNVFCCDGACQAGGGINDGVSTCSIDFDNAFLDTGTSQNLGQCPGNANAAVSGSGGSFSDYPGGPCYASCTWQTLTYSFTCCPCPNGYVPGYTQQGSARANQVCVQCTSQLEQLNQTNGAVCTPTCIIPYNGGQCQNGVRSGGCKSTTCIPYTSDLTTCSMGGTGDCKMNAQGLALLLDFEKCCSTPYYAKPKHRDLTIGCGHDCPSNGDCANYPQPMSTDAMLALLGQDLAAYSTPISQWSGIGSLNTNQFSALVDYAYHHGSGRASRCFREMIASTGSTGVCDQIRDCYPDSHKPAGTINREKAEQGLCVSPPPAGSMGCGSTGSS